jgi:hypothetical protein
MCELIQHEHVPIEGSGLEASCPFILGFVHSCGIKTATARGFGISARR